MIDFKPNAKWTDTEEFLTIGSEVLGTIVDEDELFFSLDRTCIPGLYIRACIRAKKSHLETEKRFMVKLK